MPQPPDVIDQPQESPQGIPQQMQALAAAARLSTRELARLDAATTAQILHAMAHSIERFQDEILAANGDDLDAARDAGLSAAMIDRLALDAGRIADIANAVRDIAALPTPLGEVLREIPHHAGLRIQKVRVPIGVILMIYESRPNVTADAAALCLKAGNAVILRGGSEASRSNAALFRAMLAAGLPAGLPAAAMQLVPTTDRAAVRALLQQADDIDLVIPRGGEGLIRAVAEQSRIPVLKHYKGICHVYVDDAADLDMAERIIVNAKCQRPGVCNAMETLLVAAGTADVFVPRIVARLRSEGVEVRACERSRGLVPDLAAATEDDWRAEYLDLVLSTRIVDDLDGALDHIATYGSGHSDVIVTGDEGHAERFLREVDSAAVYVNASCRFTDGGQFGMGAEIGISTDKLHARGPCGIEELTTYKYIVRGDGQTRE